MSDRHIEKCLLCFLWHSIPHKLFYHNLTTHLLLGILGFFPKYFAIMNDAAGNNPCYLAVTTHIHALLLRWSGASTTQLGLHFPDSLADGCDHVTTFQSWGVCKSHARPFQFLRLCQVLVHVPFCALSPLSLVRDVDMVAGKKKKNKRWETRV